MLFKKDFLLFIHYSHRISLNRSITLREIEREREKERKSNFIANFIIFRHIWRNISFIVTIKIFRIF